MFCAGFSSVECELLRTTFRTKPISQLCIEKQSGNIVVMEKHCFRGAQALDSIVDNFTFLSWDLPNEIFLDFWRKQKNKQCSKTLTFSQVVSEVWDPVIEQCAQLLDRLNTRSISLQEVDSFWEQYNSRPSYLKRHLILLQQGICSAKSKPTSTNDDLIIACVDKMEQYSSLKAHAQAAKFFTLFQERLGLSGDFSFVKNLADKVLM